jgi:hypothetical protein
MQALATQEAFTAVLVGKKGPACVSHTPTGARGGLSAWGRLPITELTASTAV